MYSNLTVPMPSAIELNILGGTLLINIKWRNNKTCAQGHYESIIYYLLRPPTPVQPPTSVI